MEDDCLILKEKVQPEVKKQDIVCLKLLSTDRN